MSLGDLDQEKVNDGEEVTPEQVMHLLNVIYEQDTALLAAEMFVQTAVSGSMQCLGSYWACADRAKKVREKQP